MEGERLFCVQTFARILQEIKTAGGRAAKITVEFDRAGAALEITTSWIGATGYDEVLRSGYTFKVLELGGFAVAESLLLAAVEQRLRRG